MLNFHLNKIIQVNAFLLIGLLVKQDMYIKFQNEVLNQSDLTIFI